MSDTCANPRCKIANLVPPSLQRHHTLTLVEARYGSGRDAKAYPGNARRSEMEIDKAHIGMRFDTDLHFRSIEKRTSFPHSGLAGGRQAHGPQRPSTHKRRIRQKPQRKGCRNPHGHGGLMCDQEALVCGHDEIRQFCESAYEEVYGLSTAIRLYQRIMAQYRLKELFFLLLVREKVYYLDARAGPHTE